MKTKKLLSLFIVLAMMTASIVLPTAAFAEDEFVIDENGVLIKYNGAGGDDVYIPYNVVAIGNNVFLDNCDITGVTMPNVESIGDGAFECCKNLEKVTMLNVTSIGQQAFRLCLSIHSVDMPNVTSIGNEAFCDCQNLKIVDMPNVTSIGEQAFQRCDTLESIDMARVTGIGNKAFESCFNLQSVDMSNVTSIGNEAFRDCQNLKIVDMPNVTSIGELAFQCCNILESITVSDSLTTVAKNAFDMCDSFSTVYYPCSSDVDSIKDVLGEGYDYIKLDHNFENGVCTVCGEKEEENALSLKLDGKKFTVTPSGKDKGSGIIIVALYDNENLNQLLNVKIFDLAKGEKSQDEFTQSGYVKAMWWPSLSNIMPLCGAVGKALKSTMEAGTVSGVAAFSTQNNGMLCGTVGGVSIFE